MLLKVYYEGRAAHSPLCSSLVIPYNSSPQTFQDHGTLLLWSVIFLLKLKEKTTISRLRESQKSKKKSGVKRGKMQATICINSNFFLPPTKHFSYKSYMKIIFRLELLHICMFTSADGKVQDPAHSGKYTS